MSNFSTFIIEDNEMMAQLMETMIKSIGDTEVYHYKSIESALGNVSRKPDIVLLDNGLDGHDGVDGIPIFKEFSPDTSIIVTSGEEDIKVFEQSYAYGADWYFKKDLNKIDALRDKVKLILEQKKNEQKKSSWLDNLFNQKVKIKDKKKIYVLDDDKILSFSINYALSRNPFHKVTTFNTVEKFEQQFEKSPPDIVILDYFLEDNITGMDMLKWMLSIQPDTYVVVLSVQESVDVAMKLLQIGAKNYLIKNEGMLNRITELINDIEITHKKSA